MKELSFNGAAVINAKFSIASSEGFIDHDSFTVTTKIIPVDCEDPDFPAAFALSSRLCFSDLGYGGAEYLIRDCHGDEKIKGLVLHHILIIIALLLLLTMISSQLIVIIDIISVFIK